MSDDIKPFMSGGSSSIFGSIDGEIVREYFLDNGLISCSILDYGCILRTLYVPDRNGKSVDVVLGYDDIEHYQRFPGRMGAVIGRYANRVKNGHFSIGSNSYQLSKNRGEHHIHGGFNGFDKKIWKILEHDYCHILLGYKSANGEEGYPGEMNVMVEYRLSRNCLSICYMASSDKDTICNLTNHSYFNLSGERSIDDHCVLIRSSNYIPIDQDGIPTEEMKGLPDELDLNESKEMNGSSFDLDYILDTEVESVVCYCDTTGITMCVSTDMPAIRFYTGDGLKKANGKNREIGPRSGMCFETQFPVDSPNNSLFSACILKKGETYYRKTIFSFLSG